MGDDYFRQVISSMRCGVITIDANGNLRVINEVACNMLEIENVNLVGMHCSDALAGCPEISKLLLGALKYKYLPDRAEIEIRGRKIIGFTLSIIVDDMGNRVGASVFFKDLTRVEQMREKEMLKDRLAALGQMAAGLAHEIRNPLASIEISTGLLRRKISRDQQIQHLLDNIVSGVKTINYMVSECLEFVKPVKLNRKACGLGELLNESITVSRSFFTRKAVKVEACFKDGTCDVLVDYDQMKNVFVNLIKNAYDSIEGNGKIVVSVELPYRKNKVKEKDGRREDAQLYGLDEEENFVVASIQDNGRGISKDIMSKIFNPFFTTKENGSGIGLSMVQKIVDAHMGRLDLESVEGEGTKFFVYLPVCTNRVLV